MPARSISILEVATSLTFAAHGLEALGVHPQFVEYIQYAGGLTYAATGPLSLSPPTSTCNTLLAMQMRR